MEPVTLFHAQPSLCSQKVRLALAEKGVRYSARTIDIGPRMENYEPWYVRLNPHAVVPTLQHGNQIVFDSARIVRYIDEAFPGPRLTPAEPALRAHMDDLIQRADRLPLRELSYGTIGGPLGFVARRGERSRIQRLHRKKAEAPELAAAYDAKIADVHRWFTTARDPVRVEAVKAQVLAVLDTVERELGVEPFLAGPEYSLADILWTVVLARMHMLGLGSEVARRPGLAAYYARVRARPSFQQADLWDRFGVGPALRFFLTGLRQKLTRAGQSPQPAT